MRTMKCPKCGKPSAPATVKCKCGALLVEAGLVRTRLPLAQESAVQPRIELGRKMILAAVFLYAAPVVLIPLGYKFFYGKELDAVIPVRDIVIGLSASAFFLTMWFWGRRNLLRALVFSLGGIVVVKTIRTAMDPSTLLRGVVFPLIAAVVLVRALVAVVGQRKLKLAVRLRSLRAKQEDDC